jgi:pyridoxamine 5'-phosphate oxidase
MPLDEAAMPRDPLALFDEWFKGAAAAGALQPDAMALATADGEGVPSVRMVLFKGLRQGAFIFYTNYESRKGRDLLANDRAAVAFYWPAVRHQVRVSGQVRKMPRGGSLAYFKSRPRGAQLSAAASRQSEVVNDRDELERAVLKLAARYPVQVPLPKDWGGYSLMPEWIEFWENRDDRLHDRIRYTRGGGAGWRMERLSP